MLQLVHVNKQEIISPVKSYSVRVY